MKKSLLVITLLVAVTGVGFAQEQTAPPFDDTVPGKSREEPEFRHILSKMARPYALDGSGKIVESEYPTYFGVSAGLITTVKDMAKYIIAIDKNTIISKFCAEEGCDGPCLLCW